MTEGGMGGAPESSPAGTGRPRSERVMRRGDIVVFVGLSLLLLAGLVRSAIFWFGTSDVREHPLVFVLLTGMGAVVLVNGIGRWVLLLQMRRPRESAPPAPGRVAAVTSFVPGAESAEMVKATLRALVALEGPHDTWLLDEGNDPEMRAFCAGIGARHFSRRDLSRYQAAAGPFRSGTKYGNYNAWLEETGYAAYDYVATFDPDHVPAPGFLKVALGHFHDPRVGYVQLPQDYYNQGASVVARGAAEETYAYYSSVQMASYGMGYTIIVGCHHTHRVTALKEIGGLADHDADDLLMTLRYRSAGWRGVYVPKILARGLNPVDWASYLRQQRRWARSVLDVKLRHARSYAHRLPRSARIMSTLHGLNFLHRSIIFAAGVLVTLLLLATGTPLEGFSAAGLAPWLLLLTALSICELYRQMFYLEGQPRTGLHWRVLLLNWAKWPWHLLGGLDVLLGRKPAYVLTPKAGRPGRCRALVVVNAVVAALVTAAWIMGTRGGGLAAAHHVFGGLVLLLALVTIVSELRGFPPPFDPALLRAHLLEVGAQGVVPERKERDARLAIVPEGKGTGAAAEAEASGSVS